MRSIQLVARRTLEEREIAGPRDPGPGEILVKLRSVGLCGSDLHWYLDGRVGPNQAGYPQILGHEPVAEVLSAGPNGGALKTGDRVVVEPTLSCGHCEYCLTGFHNNCVKAVFMGGPLAHGFFREYAVIPAQNATLVPESMADAQATLIEPVAVMAHLLDLVRIHAGDTVAITGAGPIGMLCASIARGCGASRVLICDRVAHRLQLARQMGADCAVDGAGTLLTLVMDETRGRGADIVLEAAGSPETINAALAMARPGGTVVLIGIASELSVPFDIHAAMSKELRIQTIKRSNHCSAKAIRLLQSGMISDAVITHRMPLQDTPQAFEKLANYEDGIGKVVIEISV
jgi:L-iditol 2-dehydrogenase